MGPTEVKDKGDSIASPEPNIKTEEGTKTLAKIATRVQSPSSINTFKHCPRKYFYQYVRKLPIRENIHLIRGKLTHTVLEKFFEIDPKILNEDNYVEELTYYLKNLFHALWSKHKSRIVKLGLTEDQIVFYYEETILMLANWLNHQFGRMRAMMDQTDDFIQVFKGITPETIEEALKSDIHMVRGFVDYIEIKGDKIKIMDYKTSKKKELSAPYKLQLAIYALMYEEKYGKRADKVGLWLLKHGEIVIDVNQELIDLAKFEIEQIHYNTQSKVIADYKRSEGPLCRWSTGQCDFYDFCMKDKRAGI